MNASATSSETNGRRRGEYGLDGNMIGLLGTALVTAALSTAAVVPGDRDQDSVAEPASPHLTEKESPE